MESILKTNNLTKTFKNQVCVDSLSIDIKRGDIYGFLGENGAGKTTSLKMILGLIPATKGEIIMFDKKIKPNDNSHFGKIGSIIEFPSFYENLTAYENLKLHQRYLNLKGDKHIYESLERLGISHAKNKKVGQFSLGMKQRLGIARAILHKPEILILDEPTNGLDPMGIKEIREFIKNIALEDKTTVIISSHILSEIEQLANRIGVIHKGKLIKEISMDNLENQCSSYVKIKVNDNSKAINILEKNMNFKDIRIENDYLIINFMDNSIQTNEVSRALINNNLDLFELVISKQNLEDYFINLVGGEKCE